MKRIVIVGGNGFLGRYLSAYFLKQKWDVVVVARTRKGVQEGVSFVQWDGVKLDTWADVLDGSELVVNFAGKGMHCRYNAKNRNAILQSRIQTTKLIAVAIHACKNAPKLWLNASSASIYNDSRECAQTEQSPLGKGFSEDVAVQWEQTFFEAEVPCGTRRVALRMGMVLAREPDSAFDVLSFLVKLRLGGRMAGGQQKVSWVSVEDMCRAVLWLSEHREAEGVYNLCAPEVLTNAEFMEMIREVNNVRWGLSSSAWMIHLGAFLLRTEAEFVLKSRWVKSERFEKEGFRYLCRDRKTLTQLLSQDFG